MSKVTRTGSDRGETARFPMRVKRGFASVTIYRRRHPRTASGYVYTVAWTIGGKRSLLSRAKFNDAQMEAVMKAEMLSAGRLAGAAMTSDDVATLDRARKICGNVPVVAALEEWLAARKLCEGPILPAARAWAERSAPADGKTVPEVVKVFLKEKKSRGVNTSASYEHFLPKLAEAFTGPISSISADLLENWIERTFRTEGREAVHPATFNTARKRLVTLWRWARVKRFLPQDMMTEAERIQSHKEEAKRREIITVKAYARVLVFLREKHPEYLAAAVLAGFCGLRRTEIHAQQWADINLKAGTLAVTAAKEGTQSERLVQIPPAAIEWLYLCADKEGLVAPPWAQDRIRALCRKHTPPIDCPENAFRHSYVSYRVASTGNVAETSLEAGNSPGVIFKNYRKPVSKEDGAEWFNLSPVKAANCGLSVKLVIPK